MRISDWSSACALPISPGFFEAYGQWMGTPPPSWDDLRWLRDQWDGPFMLKGIMRVSDARKAVDAGFSAISVSNHGGNNLDTTPVPPFVHPPLPTALHGHHHIDIGLRPRPGRSPHHELTPRAHPGSPHRHPLWEVNSSP